MSTEILPVHIRLTARIRAASFNAHPDAMDDAVTDANHIRAERHERVAAASGRQVPTPDAQTPHRMGSDPDWHPLR